MKKPQRKKRNDYPITYFEWICRNQLRWRWDQYLEWVYQQNRGLLGTHNYFKGMIKGTVRVPIHTYDKFYEFFIREGVEFPEDFRPTDLFSEIRL